MQQTLDMNTNQLATPGATTVTPAKLASVSAASCTPQGTTGATAYGYDLVSVDAAGNPSVAVHVSTATGNATLTSGNKNHLAWTGGAGADHVDVFRTVGGVTQGKIGTVVAPTATFDDTGLAGDGTTAQTQSATWGYAVAAVDAEGNETPIGAVGTGSNFPTETSVNKQALSWSAVAGAASYNIYREQAGTTPATLGKIGNTAGTTFNATGQAGDGAPVPINNNSGAGAATKYSSRSQSAVVEVSGTFVATVAVEVSSNGRDWVERGRTTGPTRIRLGHGGRRFRYVRAKVVAYTSGTPVAKLA
jgi:hypothetical protein